MNVSRAILRTLRAKNSDLAPASVVRIPPLAVSHGNSTASYLSLTGRLSKLPLELTRQECRYNRRALEIIRDQRATSLGQLAKLHSIINGTGTTEQYKSFLCGMVQVLSLNTDSDSVAKESAATPVGLLLKLSTSLLPFLSSYHTLSLNYFPASPFSSILRPGPLVLFWPHLLILPPLSLYIYKSVPALLDLWLIEPLKGVLRTFRDDEDQGGGFVRTDVIADLDSIERMTLFPAAKVDIDQILLGIDRLFKLMRLNFALVGVVPALEIVYDLGGMIFNLWRGGGEWGSKRQGRKALEGMGRIERLLFAQEGGGQQVQQFSDRLTGLLLLSLSRLQAYASRYVPLVIRRSFLEDLGDLADPQLAREVKLLVVGRMWRLLQCC